MYPPRQIGGEGDHRGKERPKMGGPNRSLGHLPAGPVEVPLHFLLYHQRLRGFRAGDALVEIAGDPGVDLTDLAV